MNALTIALMVLAAAIVVGGRRRAALFSLVAASIVLTRGASLDVFGLSLYPVRLLMLVACARVLARGELARVQWNSLDGIVISAYLYCTALFLLRQILGYGTVGVAQVSAIDRIATFFDVTVAYLSLRALLTNSDELIELFTALVAVLVPYVLLLTIERATGSNPFSAIGGVEEIWRDAERLRCRGSFMHPSLLGSFGAGLVPVYIGIILSKRRVFVATLGLGCALAIVSLANSGGPWLFAVTTAAAWALWPIRRRMRAVRYGIVSMLIILAIVMKAPIWYLPDRLSTLTGGDGWHRSYLIDQTVTHMSQWWLAGMPLNLAKDWFPYYAMGGLDITNVFVAFGLDSGLVGIGLLIGVFVIAYRRIGRKLANGLADSDRLILWALGAALTGHLANFFAITYYDQSYVIWLLLMAAIASLTSVAAPDVPPQQLQAVVGKPKQSVVDTKLDYGITTTRRHFVPSTRTPRRIL